MSDESIQQRDGSPPEKLEKLIHLALPVRLTHMKNGERGVLEMACTYDIHPRGARLLSARDVRVGDMVTIERGRNKSVCRVVWTADPNSALRGQFTVQSLDGGRVPWEEELRQAEEQYLPVTAEISGKPVSKVFRSAGQNRRRQQRFSVEGFAELADIDGKARVAGRLAQISESGCLITATDLPLPGTDLRLVLNAYDVSVALKGQVKYKADKLGMGVEFQEIRHGDRPLLNYVLSQLGKRPGGDEFAGLEVVTEPLAAESE
ncbi:MAG: PilZ domain-containing protein [Candidatus Sulfotelmatobacter sp.]